MLVTYCVLDRIILCGMLSCMLSDPACYPVLCIIQDNI